MAKKQDPIWKEIESSTKHFLKVKKKLIKNNYKFKKEDLFGYD